MPQTQQVSELTFTITTGDDDVRQGSNVVAFVGIMQGENVNQFSHSLNNGDNWPNGSTNTGVLQFDKVLVSDIQMLGIRFSSGQTNPFQTEDNWNMNTITVTYPLDAGGVNTLVNQTGSPLFRFTGSNPEWDIYFNWQ